MWVLLCTSSCIQSVGAILTEGSGDGIVITKNFLRSRERLQTMIYRGLLVV